jgi:MFS family permease
MNDRKLRLAAIIALLLAGVLAGSQLGKLAPLVGWYQNEVGFSLTLIGWFTSAIGIFVALVALPAGWVIERAGMRLSFAFAAAVMTVGGLALAFLHAPGAILAARLVEGVGYLILVIVIPALLNSVSPLSWRAPVLAIWGGFVPVGFAVADFMAGELLPVAEPKVFLLAAILAFAVLALVAAVLLGLIDDMDAGERADAKQPARSFGATMTLPVVLVALAFGIYVIASVGFFAFMPAFISWSGAGILLAAGVIALVGPVGNGLTSLLVGGRDGRFIVLLAALGLGVAALTAIPAFGGSAPMFATLALLLFAMSGGFVASALFAGLPSIVPKGGSVAVAIGLVCQAGGIGTVLGPPLAGHIIEAYGWPGFGIFLALVSAVGALCLLPVLRSRAFMPEAATISMK